MLIRWLKKNVGIAMGVKTQVRNDGAGGRCAWFATLHVGCRNKFGMTGAGGFLRPALYYFYPAPVGYPAGTKKPLSHFNSRED